MPIYEFHCKECGKDFKTLRKSNQIEGTTCTFCHSSRVARLLSMTARSGSDEGDSGAAYSPGGG